ncbi:MAG: tetratricopeptide repeat protein [Rubrivivax sp.]|nr:tetratricopeptide repeat protein [Rubrivivax sp.]
MAHLPIASSPRTRRAHGLRRFLLLLALLVALILLLAGCATRTAPAPPDALFADRLFPGSAPPVPAAEVFALSDAMRRYADSTLAATASRRDPRRALIEALYGERALQYDTSRTRTAAEAFDARAGNCLSLVIMTAAFAQHLGLPVSYRQVLVDESYTREGGLTLASGHVNLVLSRLRSRAPSSEAGSDDLSVDFLPPEQRRGQHSEPLDEPRIVAMFMNNRAAEALTQGRVAEAYAWVREALRQDPAFLVAVNTLGVVYHRAGHLREAEAALRHVLQHEPRQLAALSNLVALLRQRQRDAEAEPLATRLAALQPEPPFHQYGLGREALAEGRWADARRHFERELRLQPQQHEVHHALAIALWRLGEPAAALRHLRRAAEHGTTSADRGRYGAKLEQLRASAAAPPAR